MGTGRQIRGSLAPLLVAAVVLLVVGGQVALRRSIDTSLTVGTDRFLPAAGPGTTEPPRTAPEPAPTPTVAAAVTAVAEPLPVPALLPDDPWADTPDVSIGRIVIPTIGLDSDLGSGMTLTAINRGPAHWPGTAEPGRLGNVVVAGHRTTYTKPFRDLDRLRVGDPVIFHTERGQFTYRVTGTDVVLPEDVHIADQTSAYTATLFACHPPGSAAYRIVTRLQLVDAAGADVPPPAVTLPPVTIPRP
jgi:sortase A